MPKRYTLVDAEALDRGDPLKAVRQRFALPEGVIYLDGNSLGALPAAVKARVADVVAQEWGVDLIRGWNTHDWIDLPARVGAKIGRLIGASPGTVVVTDSTSINLFKALAVAAELRRDRGVILTEFGNFPTDGYMAQSVAHLFNRELRVAEPKDLMAALRSDVAVLTLTE